MARILDCRDPRGRAAALAAGVRSAKNGRLVAAPAETGYVLVTDAFSAGGVLGLQRFKGLAATTSLGILVPQVAAVHGIAAQLSPAALDLIAACWPGQLGLVLRLQPGLAWTVPTDRAVIRMPLHPVLLELVTGVGPCVYSGVESARLAAADVLLDCGERAAGSGSTVVDATGSPPRLVRQGAVPTDRLHAIVPSLTVA